MFKYENYNFVDNSGKIKNLSDYNGKVVMFVNTASKCGFTPQYLGLEDLYKKYKDKGLEVIAFPCNQFGQQEPGDDQSIKSFCQTYEISFTIASKIEVNGDNAHPIYRDLRAIGKGSRPIDWNFEKFIVDRSGLVFNYAPNTTPKDLDDIIANML